MRILTFVGHYLPGKNDGGPIRSIYNLTELLGDEIEFYIVCADHDKYEAPYTGIHQGWNSVGKAKVLYISNSERTARRYKTILEEVNPDLVYISSLYTATTNLPVMYWAKAKGIKVILSPRGELLDGAMKKETEKKLGYIDFLRAAGILEYVYFQGTSEEECTCIIKRVKTDDKHVCLLPNIPACPGQKERTEKKEAELKLCYVGRIVPHKNLSYVIECLKKVKSEVCFDIYGAEEDKDYWEFCQQRIRELPSNIKVEYKGSLDQSDMVERYRIYDCLISPTEFENYGQSIAEALVNDIPVIISRGTTPWDGVAENNAGYCIDLSDKEAFSKAIEDIAQMDNKKYTIMVENLKVYVRKTICYDALKQQYIRVFREIISS